MIAGIFTFVEENFHDFADVSIFSRAGLIHLQIKFAAFSRMTRIR